MHKSIAAAFGFAAAFTIASASAQVTLAIGVPAVTLGINVPVYPHLVRVPDYPVYYAPQANANYFFYDGMYWVYQQDNWYASTWYNGPWQVIAPEAVPVYVLRVPVRYYRQPPTYFRSWSANAAPRWDEYWGSSWEQNHRGWNSWNRNSMPQVAPLPVYQRQYTGNRYPSIEQQQVLRVQSYRYQPKDVVVRQYYQAQPVPYAQDNLPKQVQKEAKREQKRVEQQARFEQKQAKEQAKFERKENKHQQKPAKHE
jgi:hypothetical protein